MGKALGQGLLEFGLPAVIAVIVVYFFAPPPADGWSTVSAVTLFFGVFGSVALVTSQFFQAHHQNSMDRKLTGVVDRLQGMLGELDAKTTDLVGRIDGGKSCTVLMGLPDQPEGPTRPHLAVLGSHTQRQVRMEIFEMPFDGTPPTTRGSQLIGDVLFGHYVFLSPNVLDGQTGDHRRLYIRFTALNGTAHQLLHLRRVDGQWRAARRVMAHGETLLERNDEGFPEQPDWIADMQITPVVLGVKPYIP